LAPTKSWFGLKMGEVTVSGELLLDAGFDAGVDLTIGRWITTARPIRRTRRSRSGWIGRRRSIWTATGR